MSITTYLDSKQVWQTLESTATVTTEAYQVMMDLEVASQKTRRWHKVTSARGARRRHPWKSPRYGHTRGCVAPGAPDGLRHDSECVARRDHDSLKWSRTTLAIVGSSQHRERQNVSAGRGKTVGVRCAPSPIATMRREVR